MHVNSLGNYERGDSSPNLDFLTAVKAATAVNLDWLATGEGEMFDRPPKSTDGRNSLQPELGLQAVTRMVRLVDEIYCEEGREQPSVELATAEAQILYKEMIDRRYDPFDLEEVEAAVPMLRLVLKRRLERSPATPTNSKRHAS